MTLPIAGQTNPTERARAPIPSGLALEREIDRLRKEMKAVILAHYYQDPEIQDLADFVGDSLGLSQTAAKTDAQVIVFCGVHFMAETAKILNPKKQVLIPDLDAGCSLADRCPPDQFAKWLEQYPGHKVVSYINCSAGVKALSGSAPRRTRRRSSRASRRGPRSSSPPTATWAPGSGRRPAAISSSGPGSASSTSNSPSGNCRS
jgi:hypothetical protein